VLGIRQKELMPDTEAIEHVLISKCFKVVKRARKLKSAIGSYFENMQDAIVAIDAYEFSSFWKFSAEVLTGWRYENIINGQMRDHPGMLVMMAMREGFAVDSMN